MRNSLRDFVPRELARMTESTVDVYELLETSDEPLTAREIIEALDHSQATVYRAINSLEEEDLIESEYRFNPDLYQSPKQAFDLSRKTDHLPVVPTGGETA